MVSVLVSKVVDRGLIGCIMVSVLVSKAVDHGTITPLMNLRSTALETRMLTRSDEPTIYRFRDKNANLLHHDEPTIYRFQEKNANLSPMNP
jgi:hypothetical protein